ncbi:MAG TPA: endonuclease/exonuclease/phosphatase family protein [Actinomycetota bacterium]
MATSAARRSGPAVVELALPALTVAFGLQLLRLEMATVISVERDRLGAPITALAGFALGTLLLAFLAPALIRALGPRRAVALAAGGVALVRLAVQLLPDALARWLVAPLGVVLFCWFVPSWLARVRGGSGGRRLGVAVLLGLALDTALFGAAGSYDDLWTVGIRPVVLTAALVAFQLWLLVRAVAARGARADAVLDPGLATPEGAALPLAGFGPALFLHCLVWQNIGWQAVLGRQPDTRAFLLVMLAGLVALAIGGLLTAAPRRPGWLATLAGIAAVAVSVALQRRAVELALFLGQAGGAVLLVAIFRCATQAARQRGAARAGGETGGRPGEARTGGAFGLGMVLFGLLLFLYYAVYDVRLPYDNQVLFAVAAGLLGLAALGARLAGERRPARRPDALTSDRQALVVPVAAGLVLLLAPLGLSLATPAPVAASSGGYPVRVLSYNLHFGFDVKGWSRLEAAAAAIEASGAEVVGLQEVSRGWYINGSTDMLSWLQRRLRMPYVVFGGASDPIWGNAILSRYPIRGSGVVPLPRAGVPLRRNFIWALVDLGGGQTLRVIATHLHQVEGPAGAPARLEQVPRLLAGWARSPATVVLGDFNATPDSREVAMLRAAGLRDAWSAAGSPPAEELTYASNRPYERIDYLWLSPDLRASAFTATTTTASDHRGIAVTLQR